MPLPPSILSTGRTWFRRHLKSSQHTRGLASFSASAFPSFKTGQACPTGKHLVSSISNIRRSKSGYNCLTALPLSASRRRLSSCSSPTGRVQSLASFSSTSFRTFVSVVPSSTNITSEGDNEETPTLSILKEPITRVTTIAAAQQVLKVLYAHPEVYWACDTEVADIDLKTQGPVGHGKVTCISVFGGADIDFGLGEGKGSVLWVENINESDGLLQEFKSWFEDGKYKKVWHNYGFDRHVMFNEGIDCQGFAGDTMHMARLWDTSLDRMEGAGGYSLAALSSLLLEEDSTGSSTINSSSSDGKYSNSVPSASYSSITSDDDGSEDRSSSSSSAKESMMDLFGVAKMTKSGTPSKVKTLPSVWELQTDPVHREKWIQYSAKDAVCTFQVHAKLAAFLSNMSWEVEAVSTATPFSSSSSDGDSGGDSGVVDGGVIRVHTQGSMYTFYENYLRKFGELLTDMERNGIKVDVAGHLAQAEQQARCDKEHMQNLFVSWMERYVKDAEYVNLASTTQMQQLFFGHYKDKVLLDKSRVFSMEKGSAQLESETAAVVQQNRYAKWTAVEMRKELKTRGVKGLSGKKAQLLERLLQDDADIESAAFHLDGSSETTRDTGTGSSGPCSASQHATDNPSGDRTDGANTDMPHLTDSYQQMSVEALQDICVSRRIHTPRDLNASDSSVLKATLIDLISADIEKFLLQQQRVTPMPTLAPPPAPLLPPTGAQLGYTTAWPSPSEPPYPPPSPSSSRQNEHTTTFSPSASPESATPPGVSISDVAQLKAPKRHIDFTINSFGIKPKEFTPAGVPKVGHAVLAEMSGSGLSFFENDKEKGQESHEKFGSVYKHFGGGDEGRDACRAIGALARVSQIETMIGTFLVPLQALADEGGRIHCSLNLNTETGRLSSRKPNLQNQPALEKDQYKIRDAFVAEEGNTLLVADYGQLELRLMAHMTQCRSMLEAFRSGGCFHSRTAVGMYPHIQEAIARGDVLLEWDYSKGSPPKPLVKDVYGSERRKAKTLNFSIAYGKTIHGLAKDWGISTEEAKETLEAWYRDRPEVREWQENTRAMAKRDGYVRTIMGRRRNLKEANTYGAAGSHALRAAINTPIQGSAADVVMMAMIHLGESQELKQIGWKLLLQIHDEVILEGPREHKDRAMAEVMRCMQHPFDGVGLLPLSVKLEVDAKTADTWYEAK